MYLKKSKATHSVGRTEQRLKKDSPMSAGGNLLHSKNKNVFEIL